MPKVKELIEYLMDNSFKEDQEICILIGDLEKRRIWKPKDFIGVTDSEEGPLILLEIAGEGEDMDEGIEDEIEELDLEDQLDALLEVGDRQLDDLAKGIK